jgi:hypothetical protein
MSNRWKCGGRRSKPIREVASGLPEADAFRFRREGKLPPGADRIVLDAAGTKVAVSINWEPVHFGGARPWFRCPWCSARRRFLRAKGDQLACFTCLGLAHRSRAQRWKMARPLHRVARLRLRLGLDPRPFTPPLHPIRIKRYTVLLRELAICEAELLRILK